MIDSMKATQCAILRRTSEGYEGMQGGVFSQGVSAQSVGSTALCLHELRMAPHSTGQPHVHAGHESAIYVISGSHHFVHGPELNLRTQVHAGDMIFVPADTPHTFVTGTEPVHVIVARTDPNEQESVHLLVTEVSAENEYRTLRI